MCWSCVVGLGGHFVNLREAQPVRDAADRIRELYALPGCSTGGPLHVVTDDINVDDALLDVVRERVADIDDGPTKAAVEAVLVALVPLSEAERARACWEGALPDPQVARLSLFRLDLTTDEVGDAIPALSCGRCNHVLGKGAGSLPEVVAVAEAHQCPGRGRLGEEPDGSIVTWGTA